MKLQKKNSGGSRGGSPPPLLFLLIFLKIEKKGQKLRKGQKIVLRAGPSLTSRSGSATEAITQFACRSAKRGVCMGKTERPSRLFTKLQKIFQAREVFFKYIF